MTEFVIKVIVLLDPPFRGASATRSMPGTSSGSCSTPHFGGHPQQVRSRHAGAGGCSTPHFGGHPQPKRLFASGNARKQGPKRRLCAIGFGEKLHNGGGFCKPKIHFSPKNALSRPGFRNRPLPSVLQHEDSLRFLPVSQWPRRSAALPRKRPHWSSFRNSAAVCLSLPCCWPQILALAVCGEGACPHAPRRPGRPPSQGLACH